MGALQIKHLFGLQGVSKQDIRTILDNTNNSVKFWNAPSRRFRPFAALRW